jgi:hypothetical protein
MSLSPLTAHPRSGTEQTAPASPARAIRAPVWLPSLTNDGLRVLDEHSLDFLARRLAVLLIERLESRTPRAPLVDVEAVARYLAVDPSYVYEHAAELGARRLGSGPKARLRFRLEDVDKHLTSCCVSRQSPAPEPHRQDDSRRRRRPPTGTSPPLLPIRGRAGDAECET